MPFVEHPSFEPPENEDQKTWRYMDFTKFVSLLDRKALFFPSLHTLAKDDAFEGALAAPDFRHRNWTCFEDMAEEFKSMINPNDSPAHKANFFQQIWGQQEAAVQAYVEERADYHVNCWHLNDIESLAMWKVYVTGTEGVAIQSSYHRMMQAIVAEQEVHIGKVRYIDYTTESTGLDANGFIRTLRKRKPFAFENELRMVYLHDPRRPIRLPIGDDFSTVMIPAKDEDYTKRPAGTEIAVDLWALVERVYVSPSCQPWFVDLVKSVLSKYGLEVKVVHSDLSAAPLT